MEKAKTNCQAETIFPSFFQGNVPLLVFAMQSIGAELLELVAAWNEALENYGNNIGLTGEEGDSVVQKHTATSLASYGKPQ